jgi:RNA polymerase sigma-70 factor (ECF subfamily)
MQNALMHIWKKLYHIKGHPNPQALILRICINAAYDVLRKQKRWNKQEVYNILSSDIPDPGPMADEEISNAEKRKEIFNAIAQLSRNQAVAVMMRFMEELSYNEIAQALGCGEATARKHVTRARAKLRQLLAHMLPLSVREAAK